MDRCPNCRARLDGAEQCRRCGLELGLLRAVDRASRFAVGRALHRLLAGDQAGAIADLEQARSLRDEGLIQVLLGFARAAPEAVEPARDALEWGRSWDRGGSVEPRHSIHPLSSFGET
jgi:hypothetical protein